jgi:PhnO protein
MKFRKARKTDLEKIYSMMNELEGFSLDQRRFSKIYHNNLKDKNIHYVLALKNGQSVGFISLHIQNLLHHAGKVAEIQELFIDPAARSEGIGEKLVSHVRAIAKRLNCDSFETTSNVKRKRAHQFYKRKTGMNQTHYKFTQKL